MLIGAGAATRIVNLHFEGNTAVNNGGGLCAIQAPSTISNCTFVDNDATIGGGMMVWLTDCTIENTIVTGSTGGGAVGLDTGTATLIYCDLFNNTGGDWTGGIAGQYGINGNISSDPLFVTGPLGDHYLSQLASGQAGDSPCVDTGDPASDLILGTTRSDHVDDAGVVDMGYHFLTRDPTTTLDATLSCIPDMGTVPFQTQMQVTLHNQYTGSTRRMAGRINVVVASGTSYNNWRSGFTNIAASDTYDTQFSVNFPAVGSVIGQNVFTLLAEDVTPSPYNQPPHPPAGDTASDNCKVTASAP